jgi:hypothetical protein
MKLKPEIRTELARRRKLARTVRRGDAANLREMAVIVRKNNWMIRLDPTRERLGVAAAANMRRLELALQLAA